MRIRKRANLPPPESPAPPQSPPAPSPPQPSRAAPRVALPDPRPQSGGDVNIRLPAAVQESANPRWDFFTNYQQREDEIEDEGYHTTSPRKESVNLAAELIASMRYSSYTSSYATGGQGEGYRTFLPLKKRKGGFEVGIGGTSREGAAVSGKEEMKSKTNKKCLLQNGYTKEAEYDEDERSVVSGGGGSKKCKRGSVIMEGSRCSRVNGRGWRCSQPTLVGYSLCEHHLGKGRLRSMNSSRNRGRLAAARAGVGDHPLKLGTTDKVTARAGDGGDHPQKLGTTDNHYGMAALVDQPGRDGVIAFAPMQNITEVGKNLDSDDGEEEKMMQNIQEVGTNLDSDDGEEVEKMNPLVQKKMGVVKARSMSSLLGQMDDGNKEVAIPNNIGRNRFPWLL